MGVFAHYATSPTLCPSFCKLRALADVHPGFSVDIHSDGVLKLIFGPNPWWTPFTSNVPEAIEVLRVGATRLNRQVSGPRNSDSSWKRKFAMNIFKNLRFSVALALLLLVLAGSISGETLVKAGEFVESSSDGEFSPIDVEQGAFESLDTQLIESPFGPGHSAELNGAVEPVLTEEIESPFGRNHSATLNGGDGTIRID